MKKLSDITESIWSDIQDRSAGDTVRKEDDVNLLDKDEFYDYLKNKYNKISHLIYKDPSEINIKLGWSYFPRRDYKIDIHWVEKNKIKNLYLNFGPCELDTLCNKKFKTGTANDGISNEEILNIIDFCLDYISSHKEIESPMSPLSESIWSDIQDRSSGDTVRKEDDIDNLNYEEFFTYLTEHYQPKSKKGNEKISGRTPIMDTDIIEIFIPIEYIDSYLKGLMVKISKKDKCVVSMITSQTLFDKYVNLERMLSNNYALNASEYSYRMYIKPKKKPTNKTAVDLIDIFLDVVDNPILEKIS